MSTRAKRQSRQCYCARRSRSGSRIALLSHCVHPKGKMPARSAGIFYLKNYSRARASTGSSRAAFRAGNQPNKIPVAVEQRNASSSANGEKPISQPGKKSCKVKAINSDSVIPNAPPTSANQYGFDQELLQNIACSRTYSHANANFPRPLGH